MGRARGAAFWRVCAGRYPISQNSSDRGRCSAADISWSSTRRRHRGAGEIPLGILTRRHRTRLHRGCGTACRGLVHEGLVHDFWPGVNLTSATATACGRELPNVALERGEVLSVLGTMVGQDKAAKDDARNSEPPGRRGRDGGARRRHLVRRAAHGHSLVCRRCIKQTFRFTSRAWC